MVRAREEERKRGRRSRTKKIKRQMSRGSGVADGCDVQLSAAVQVEKTSLCDADDKAISPALSRPMGSSPGDIENRTLIRWVGVLQALINTVSQYLGCVWRSDLSQGTLSLVCFPLRPGSVAGDSHMVSVYDSVFT